MIRLALFLALMPLAASAQSQQMLRTIDSGLRSYGIQVDVNTLTNAQVTALYFELNSSDDDRRGTSRQALLNIVRKGEDF